MYSPVLIGRILAIDKTRNDIVFMAASGFLKVRLQFVEGHVSAAWIGVPGKVREMLGNFTLPREWSPCVKEFQIDRKQRIDEKLRKSRGNSVIFSDFKQIISTTNRTNSHIAVCCMVSEI